VTVRTFTETSRESPRPPPADSRERAEQRIDRECLPSRENLCPAASSRTPGSGLSRHRGLATAVPIVDAFESQLGFLWKRLWDPGPRPHVPFASGSCFSEPGRRSPTSATSVDARAHPTSCRSSHASEAFAPLLAGTNRCQLRWPGAVLPRRGPANRALHAPAFARGVPLAWTKQTARAGALERR